MSSWSTTPPGTPFATPGTPMMMGVAPDPMQRLENQVNRLERISWILMVGLVALAALWVISIV